jgi:hypothetical protein
LFGPALESLITTLADAWFARQNMQTAANSKQRTFFISPNLLWVFDARGGTPHGLRG